ncbi:MAG: AAA family ATPase [Saprospiraceae bacterium]|nr:AAA family ATPase [Saprospiraceae bacterium]
MEASVYRHIHVLGAPGAGVTTLGKALAKRLGLSHFDTDDYYWFTDDDLPYRRKRNPEHRLRLLRPDLESAADWVLSGSLCGWGDSLADQFDLVVYLWAPAALRQARIRQREEARYGADRLSPPDGDLNKVYEKFQTWAAGYDSAEGNIRSRAAELNWLEQFSCPVIRIEEDMPVDAMVSRVIALKGS